MSSTPHSPPPVWQTHLNVSESAASKYHEFLNPSLRDMLSRPPRLMLDIGCASGLFGAFVKEKYPDTRVVGVELNRAAAQAARNRIDHVFEGKFEDIDLAAAGIERASIDTVIVADVLEHMYDPWRAMVSLKRMLAPDAQLIASIPNTRNLGLIAALADGGDWRYDERGLLDITHIRFFTLKGIRAFFSETGYRIEHVALNIDPNFAPLYKQNAGNPSISFEMGRLRFSNLSPHELAELCTWQFFVRAKPA